MLDSMLHKVSDHHCLVLHCAASPNPSAWHVAAAD